MPAKVNVLSDVNPVAVSIVRKGANRQRWFLRKTDGVVVDDASPIAGETDPLLELPTTHDPIVKADWSAVYCVVAEPGARENAGLVGDQDIEDEWASADEIRKAAHRFMKNGGLINKLHEDLEPYGKLVENAVALADFEVDGEVIRKGSWYIAIEPTADGRAAIEAGEFEGVSMQGTGIRTLVEKAKTPLGNKPGVSNWVERTGGFPKELRDLMEEIKGSRPGMTDSAAIARGISVGRKYAAGVTSDGKGKISEAKAAKWKAVMARYEAQRASTHVKKETRMSKLLDRIAKAVGIDPDDPEFAAAIEDIDEVEDIHKSLLTFSQIMGRRELSDELPTFMDALRESIYNAFYPYNPDGDPPTPKEIRAALATSLDEAAAHLLGLYDGLAGGTIKKSSEELAKELATISGESTDLHKEQNDMAREDTHTIESLAKSQGELASKVDTLVEALTPMVKAYADRVEAERTKTPAELAEALEKAQADLAQAQSDIAKLSQGDSAQPRTPDQVVKSDLTPEQAAAEEIFG